MNIITDIPLLRQLEAEVAAEADLLHKLISPVYEGDGGKAVIKLKRDRLADGEQHGRGYMLDWEIRVSSRRSKHGNKSLWVTYELGGERISARAVQLLVRAYGVE